MEIMRKFFYYNIRVDGVIMYIKKLIYLALEDNKECFNHIDKYLDKGEILFSDKAIIILITRNDGKRKL